MVEPAEIEQRVIQALDRSGLPYELLQIDPAFADTADFCARYGYPASHSANTLLVASKKPPGRLCACVVAADRRLDVNRRVKQLLGVSRLSFAPAELTVERTGMQIGGVTALALPPELPIYVDAALLELPYVILGGGSRGLKVRVGPELFQRLPGAQVVPELAPPPA